ncbi:unnamed protein product, partial [Rotaria socialis]
MRLISAIRIKNSDHGARGIENALLTQSYSFSAARRVGRATDPPPPIFSGKLQPSLPTYILFFIADHIIKQPLKKTCFSENTSYSAMLNIPEPVPLTEPIPSNSSNSRTAQSQVITSARRYSTKVKPPPAMSMHLHLLVLATLLSFLPIHESFIVSLGGTDNLAKYRNLTGQSFQVIVTGNNQNWFSVWGTDIYTDSSSVAAAAVHAGVLLNGQTGTLTVTLLSAQTSYLATTRNAVNSQSSGSSAGSFCFGSLSSPTNLMSYRGQVGRMFPFLLQGVKSNATVYGTDIYGDQSNLAAAAVHSGVLSVGQTRIIIVTILAGQNSYAGSSRNNVTSLPLGVWNGSFSFFQLTSPSTLDPYQALVGRSFPVLLSGTAESWVGGSDIYSTNSDVSTASVHAGVRAKGQTAIVIVTILAGQSSYLSTSRNQVQSWSFGSWATSFCFGSLSSPTNLMSYRSQVGRMFAFLLQGVNSNAAVYGTDIYGDQSNVAAAAVHSGVLSVGQTQIIIVTILAGQNWYVGSSRNNITSLPLGVWNGSFSFFQLISPSTLDPYQALVGRSFPVLLSGGFTSWVGGSDIYSTNSDLPSASVHAGVRAKGQSAIVIVTILAGQSSYLSTTLNGVESSSFDSWAASFCFGTLSSPTNLMSYRNQTGRMFAFLLQGVNSNATVYGTDIYGDQSNLAAAAVHSGVLSVGQTRIIIVTILAGQNSYIGSTRNNITSLPLGVWNGSFSFFQLASPSTLDPYQALVGRSFPVLLSGGYIGFVGGSDIYSTNSDLPSASVHAGVRAKGQTAIVIVTILAGQSSYLSTTLNGVESSSFGSWAASFCFGTLSSPTNLTSYRNQIGRMFAFLLQGVKSNATVYGTDIYGDQSNLAAAAVHSGVLSVGQTRIIIV